MMLPMISSMRFTTFYSNQQHRELEKVSSLLFLLLAPYKVTMEMEWVCSKILDMKKRVSWPSQMAFPNQPKPWSVDLLKVEEENIKIRKMSLDGVHEVGRCGR